MGDVWREDLRDTGGQMLEVALFIGGCGVGGFGGLLLGLVIGHRLAGFKSPLPSPRGLAAREPEPVGPTANRLPFDPDFDFENALKGNP